MAKKVAGKKYFYALGQRERSKHFEGHRYLNIWNSPKPRKTWPLWARNGFACGLYGFDINDLDGNE